MQSWHVVHRRCKRLPPAAAAFKAFLIAEGAARIEAITHFGSNPRTRPGSAVRTSPAGKRTATRVRKRTLR